MKTNYKKIAVDGVITSNPTFKLVLGTCPTLALTTLAMNGIGMGAAVTFVLICSNVFVSLLRNVIPDKVRIPAFVLIIATFVTIVRLVLDKFLPSIYESLGLYLPSSWSAASYSRGRKALPAKRRARLRGGRPLHGHRFHAGAHADGRVQGNSRRGRHFRRQALGFQDRVLLFERGARSLPTASLSRCSDTFPIFCTTNAR